DPVRGRQPGRGSRAGGPRPEDRAAVIDTPEVPSSTGPPSPGGRQGVPRWRRAPGQPGLLRGNPLLLAGGAIALLIVVVALAAPLLAPYPADAGSATHPFAVLRPPS